MNSLLLISIFIERAIGERKYVCFKCFEYLEILVFLFFEFKYKFYLDDDVLSINVLSWGFLL